MEDWHIVIRDSMNIYKLNIIDSFFNQIICRE